MLARLLPALLLVVSLVFLPRLAAAQPDGQPLPARVLVVDVQGDALDAGALRETIAKELKATVVAPDDPRAAKAEGRLTIEAKEIGGPMTVRYQALGAPVARTVMLPMNPKNAQRAAVFMAGNLARDEAGDVLFGMPRASAAPEAAPTAEPQAKDDDARQAEARREYVRVQGLLDHYRQDARRARAVRTVASSLYAAAAIPVGIYLSTTSNEPDTRRGVGAFLTGTGTAELWWAMALQFGSDPHEQLKHDLDVEARKGASPVELLEKAERDWDRFARDARSARHLGAGFSLVLSAALLGGTAYVGATRNDGAYFVGWGLATGAILFTIGVERLLVETPIETSFRTYQAMKGIGTPPPAPSAARPRPIFGVAPLPGGGYATAGVLF
jgi:hypothetical protein